MGSAKRNVAPSPGGDVTVRVPPCASALPRSRRAASIRSAIMSSNRGAALPDHEGYERTKQHEPAQPGSKVDRVRTGWDRRYGREWGKGRQRWQW